jgi:predicted HTH transcriptional regulator
VIYKVFISSVQKELQAEREAVNKMVSEDALFSEYFTPYIFEARKGAKSHSAKKEYTENAADCDVYIGIVGNEYGKKGKDGLSPVEREYNEAKEKCVYILIKGKKDDGREKETIKFLKKIKDEDQGHCYKRFETMEELLEIVRHSLVDYLKIQGDIFKGNFEDRPVKDATLDDIDNEKIEWFIRTATAVKRLKLPAGSKPVDVLKHFELLHKGKPTIAAILLFGKKPQKYFRISEINCAHYPGVENVKPMISQHVYEGTLFDQVDNGAAFVLGAISRAVIQKPGRADFDRPFEIPEFVVEEAITNAIVHRNYAEAGSVQLGLFADRLDVWNPGTLMKGLSLEMLKQVHSSKPRNPKIAEVMFRAGYIQKQGTGIAEMMRKCREKGLPEPEFKLMMSDILVTVRRDIYSEEMMKKAGLNERQINAMLYVKQKGSISNKEYQITCKVSKRTATRDLTGLIERNILKFTGKKGAGARYVIK